MSEPRCQDHHIFCSDPQPFGEEREGREQLGRACNSGSNPSNFSVNYMSDLSKLMSDLSKLVSDLSKLMSDLSKLMSDLTDLEFVESSKSVDGRY